MRERESKTGVWKKWDCLDEQNRAKKHTQEHAAAPHVDSHTVYDVVWALTQEREQMLT